MVLDLASAINYLMTPSVMEAVLPFILFFTVIFAILQMTKIFDENSRKFNVVIAIVFAFIPIYTHFAGMKPDVVSIVIKALPQVSLWLIIGLSFLLLLGLFGIDKKTVPFFYYLRAWLPWLAILLLAYIFFGKSIGLEMIISQDLINLVVVLAIFGLIIWFITKPDETPEERHNKKLKAIENRNKLNEEMKKGMD